MLVGGLAIAGCATAEGPSGGPDSGVVGIASDAGGGADAPSNPRPVVDAAPLGTPDASPQPDAAVVPPPVDAGPTCTSSEQNVLVNANFDSGPGNWIESSGANPTLAIVTDEYPSTHSGVYAAWLGGYLPGGIDSIYQQFTLPGDATNVRIDGYRLIGTQEIGSLAWDLAEVQLRSSSGAFLETLGSFDNADANSNWVSFSFTPTGNYAGQTLRLYIVADTDATNNTNFLFDSMGVRATFCN